MPLPVAHLLVGASLAEALLPADTAQRPQKVLAAALLAIAPDLDFAPILAFDLDRALHRGFTHSATFAALAGIASFLLLGRDRARESMVHAAAMLSHGLLDALTSVHGRGVQLLWPWLQSRYQWGRVDIFEGHLEADASWPQVAFITVQQTLIEAALFGLVLWAVLRLRRRAASIA